MKLNQQVLEFLMANGRRPNRPQGGPSERQQRVMETLNVDPSTLTEQLTVVRNAFAFVSETEEDAKALDEARAAGVKGAGASALTIGASVPDFRLPDQAGQIVCLYDRLKAGPVVLSFYRGMWCPFCNLELRALQAALPEFEKLGAALIAISPQTPDRTVSTAELNALTFDVLSDSGSQVAEQFGVATTVPEAIVDHQRDDLGFDVADYNASGDRRVPVPATFIIGRDKNVAFVFVNDDYRYRLDPADIISNLQAMAAAR